MSFGPFVKKLLGGEETGHGPSGFGRRGRLSVGTVNLEPQRSRGSHLFALIGTVSVDPPGEESVSPRAVP